MEFATNQFEENTKKIEELIRQREANIAQAGNLKQLIDAVTVKELDWKNQVKDATDLFGEDIIETLNIVGESQDDNSEDYKNALKILNARVNNLESNLHIEIDMERIEDRSKALSYIGIEIADALKSIPTPVEEVENQQEIQEVQQVQEEQQYIQETTFETKPSLWQRFKNSKFVRAMKAITRIRIVIDAPNALPEGRGENN